MMKIVMNIIRGNFLCTNTAKKKLSFTHSCQDLSVLQKCVAA